MAVEVSPNTSTTRNTDISVESPDAAAMKPGTTNSEKVEHLANEGAERAAKRINMDKGSVPGTQEFTK